MVYKALHASSLAHSVSHPHRLHTSTLALLLLFSQNRLDLSSGPVSSMFGMLSPHFSLLHFMRFLLRCDLIREALPNPLFKILSLPLPLSTVLSYLVVFFLTALLLLC